MGGRFHRNVHLLQEQVEALKADTKIQVFATDINSRAIGTARAGNYPDSISGDISPERLEKYFNYDKEAGTYRINKNIREMLIFSEQDFIMDPPYSRLDLISCRNLLIYMGAGLQKRLIPMFHFALLPGKFLFLGNSESIGEFHDLFAITDLNGKLFQAKFENTSSRKLIIRKYLPLLIENDAFPRQTENFPKDLKSAYREMAERTMIQQCVPVGVLVNAHGDIFYLHGRTGMYLEPAPDEVVTNILKMAREGLKRDLMTSLHQAATTGTVVTRKGLKVKTNGHFTCVDLTVRPVSSSTSAIMTEEVMPDAESKFMVILEEVAEVIQKRMEETPLVPKGHDNLNFRLSEAESMIDSLQKELQAKEEYLKSAVEELETSNEEMQSVNEELQSTNEELGTSKEELQSVNEELVTVNNDLQSKLSDLTRLNNDISNLLAGTGIGTVFVDRQLRIISFTPAATRIINLIPSDLGRPVAHTVSNLVGYDRLVPDALEVQVTELPKELEVLTTDGVWYTMRILPYRTRENVVEGVVINFVDITELKQARDKILEINRDLEKRVQYGIEEIRAKDHIMIAQSRLAAMGEMIRNIAHQWRQPLNALGLMIQNIAVAYENSRLCDAYIQTFKSKTMNLIQHMSQTITDFSNYFKPSNEKMKFSMQDIIRKTVDLVEPGLKDEGISLTSKMDNDCEISGYSNEFGQVLLNLIQNAKEAFLQKKTGDKWILISVTALEKETCVNISDNAGGIPAEILDKVFDPYFTTKESGTGIGLYMSRMIIENQMKGRLNVGNTSEGAEFTITLKGSSVE